MRAGALTQYDCCPYKKDIWTQGYTEKRGHEEPQGIEGHLQAKERGLDGSFPQGPWKEPTLPTP